MHEEIGVFLHATVGCSQISSCNRWPPASGCKTLTAVQVCRWAVRGPRERDLARPRLTLRARCAWAVCTYRPYAEGAPWCEMGWGPTGAWGVCRRSRQPSGVWRIV